MARSLFSVVGGYVVWTLVYLGGSAWVHWLFESAHNADGSTESAGLLLLYLGLSIMASLLAGAVAARVASTRPMRMVAIVAALLLATGIPVQISYWETLPVWYHVLFLAALVPMTLLGGRVVRQPR